MKPKTSFSLPRLAAVLVGLTIPVLVLPAHAQNLNGAGATFPYPLYSKWFAVYKQQTGVAINYQAVGSGAGIKQMVNHTVDFGASDAPLSNAELAAIPGKVVQIPTVAGAISVVYNLPGVSGLKLSGDTTAAIFQGQITHWNDKRIAALNPGAHLPSSAISVAHRSDGSGTSFIFTNYLSSVSSSWKSQVGAGKSVSWPVGLGGKGNDGVAGVVRSTNGAIGYVELAYALHNHLASALLRNRAGHYVAPSATGATAAALSAAGATARDPRTLIVNGSGARDYPISGYTFVMYFANTSAQPRGQQVVKFLKWAVGPGQAYASGLSYARLPASVVAADRSRLR